MSIVDQSWARIILETDRARRYYRPAQFGGPTICPLDASYVVGVDSLIGLEREAARCCPGHRFIPVRVVVKIESFDDVVLETLRGAALNRVRVNALAKLTEDERDALGFS